MDRFACIFNCTFVLLVFVLLVSSATDVDPVSGTKEVEASDTQPQSKETNAETPQGTSDSVKRNCTGNGTTECSADQSFVSRLWHNMSDNRSLLYAAVSVVGGITAVVALCFIVKAVRIHRRRRKSRKYGVISTQGDLEMEPLGQSDEDDEDLTVFEINGKSK